MTTANWCVEPGVGNDANTGTTWGSGNSLATLGGALAKAWSAGDIIAYKANTQETALTGNVFYNGPQSNAAPLKIVSSTAGSSGTATISRSPSSTTAQIFTTGNYSVTFNGGFILDGLYIDVGNSIDFTVETDEFWVAAYNCKFEYSSNASAQIFNIGGNGKGYLYDCDINFQGTGNPTKILGVNNNTQAIVRGGTLTSDVASRISNAIIDTNAVNRSTIKLYGLDISTLTSASSVIGGANPNAVFIHNCKLPSGVTILDTADVSIWNPEDLLITACDGNTYHIDGDGYLGQTEEDTSKYRTGGATDGTPYSWLITTTAQVDELAAYRSPWTSVWIDSTGTVTITGYITTATAQTDADVWLEYEYLNGTDTLITRADTRPADHYVTGTTLTTAGTWTGALAQTQKVEATSVTIGKKGWLRVRYGTRTASETDLYVCPEIEVS